MNFRYYLLAQLERDYAATMDAFLTYLVLSHREQEWGVVAEKGQREMQLWLELEIQAAEKD